MSAREESVKQTIDQFWDTIPLVWNLIRGHLRAIAAEQLDISVEQFHVLRLIRRGHTSASEIADARQTSRPAVSQAVDGLVEKGLVTRRQETDDRRFVHLALTPAGETLINQVFEQNRGWMVEKMQSLNTEDLARITEGLELLKSAFSESEPNLKETLPAVTGTE